MSVTDVIVEGSLVVIIISLIFFMLVLISSDQ